MDLLDERTVIVMMALTQGILAAIAASLRFGHPEDVRGIGSWAMTMACCAAGNLVVGYNLAFPFGPPPLLANVFFYPAAVLLGISILRFFGQDGRLSPWIFAAVVGYVAGGLFSIRPEHAAWKVLIIMLMFVVSIALGFKAAIGSPDVRRGVGGKVLVMGLLLLALAAGLRIFTALQGGEAVLLSGVLATMLPTFLTITHIGLVLVTMGMVVLATERMRRRLEALANHDVLTGVLTRRGLSALARHAVANARREKTTIGFLIADIDLFKVVNDKYGHLAGDAMLARVGRVLREQSREVDLVARFGGEEFAVLLPNTDLKHVCEVAERMRCNIAAEVLVHDDQEVQVTLSIGVAALPATAASVDILYSLADSALFRAKAAGRNRVEVAECPT